MDIYLFRYLLFVNILSFFLWITLVLLHIILNCCNCDVVVYCNLMLEKTFFRLIYRLHKLGCLCIFQLSILSVVHFYLGLLSRVLFLLYALFLLRCLLLIVFLFNCCCLSEWYIVWFSLHFYLQRNINI